MSLVPSVLSIRQEQSRSSVSVLKMPLIAAIIPVTTMFDNDSTKRSIITFKILRLPVPGGIAVMSANEMCQRRQYSFSYQRCHNDDTVDTTQRKQQCAPATLLIFLCPVTSRDNTKTLSLCLQVHLGECWVWRYDTSLTIRRLTLCSAPYIYTYQRSSSLSLSSLQSSSTFVPVFTSQSFKYIFPSTNHSGLISLTSHALPHSSNHSQPR